MNRAEYPPLDPAADFAPILGGMVEAFETYLSHCMWQTVDAILQAEQPRHERRIRLLFGLIDHALDYPAWQTTPATPPRARQFLELRAQALNNARGWHHLVQPLLDGLASDGRISADDSARLGDRLLACRR